MWLVTLYIAQGKRARSSSGRSARRGGAGRDGFASQGARWGAPCSAHGEFSPKKARRGFVPHRIAVNLKIVGAAGKSRADVWRATSDERQEADNRRRTASGLVTVR